MKTIHKYPLSATDLQTVPMPKGAKILHVALQAGSVCLWAEVFPAMPKVNRCIEVFGTGNPMDESFLRVYIGTVQDGSLVWHIYERL